MSTSPDGPGSDRRAETSSDSGGDAGRAQESQAPEGLLQRFLKSLFGAKKKKKGNPNIYPLY